MLQYIRGLRVVVAMMISGLMTCSALGATWVVNSDPEHGPVVTLSQAITGANASPEGDTIAFDESVDGTVVGGGFTLTDDGITILGDRDGDGQPNVTVSGGGQFGIRINSRNNRISGLLITGNQTGVLIKSGANSNHIGPNNVINGNTEDGVVIEADNNFVFENALSIRWTS